MAQTVGKNGKVMIGSATLAEMASWTLNIKLDTAGEYAFNDSGWKTTAGTVGQTFNGSVSGWNDPSDTAGQIVLQNTAISGTKITNMKLYEDATNYWTTSGTAGVYISNLAISTERTGVNKISFDFEGTGAVYRTT